MRSAPRTCGEASPRSLSSGRVSTTMRSIRWGSTGGSSARNATLPCRPASDGSASASTPSASAVSAQQVDVARIRSGPRSLVTELDHGGVVDEEPVAVRPQTHRGRRLTRALVTRERHDLVTDLHGGGMQAEVSALQRRQRHRPPLHEPTQVDIVALGRIVVPLHRDVATVLHEQCVPTGELHPGRLGGGLQPRERPHGIGKLVGNDLRLAHRARGAPGVSSTRCHGDDERRRTVIGECPARRFRPSRVRSRVRSSHHRGRLRSPRPARPRVLASRPRGLLEERRRCGVRLTESRPRLRTRGDDRSSPVRPRLRAAPGCTGTRSPRTPARAWPRRRRAGLRNDHVHGERDLRGEPRLARDRTTIPRAGAVETLHRLTRARLWCACPSFDGRRRDQHRRTARYEHATSRGSRTTNTAARVASAGNGSRPSVPGRHSSWVLRSIGGGSSGSTRRRPTR